MSAIVELHGLLERLWSYINYFSGVGYRQLSVSNQTLQHRFAPFHALILDIFIQSRKGSLFGWRPSSLSRIYYFEMLTQLFGLSCCHVSWDRILNLKVTPGMNSVSHHAQFSCKIGIDAPPAADGVSRKDSTWQQFHLRAIGPFF